MVGSRRSLLLKRCAAAIAIASCASPTEIHVTVFTDVACSTGAQASIVGGTSLADLANKAPAGASTQCVAAADGTNALGDVVVQPSGDKSAEVAFEFMIRPDGAPADSCTDPANVASCIVARREIHFSQHNEINMRVDLRVSCLGVVCGGTDTCVDGQCESASAPCSGATCTESSLIPQGTGGVSHLARIAGGETHTCAITPTGGLKCWGSNGSGQLGDGTTNESHVPVQVKGLTSGVISVVAGENYTCALMSTNTVKCWGNNGNGEVGNSGGSPNNAPVDVPGLTGVASISAGCKFMCAQLAAGGVKCWGENGNGQLGNGANTDSSTPVDVKGISDATYAASGFDSACAAFPNGVQCWGQDSSGQLGDGKQTDSNVPVDTTQVTFGPTILASGAYHVFAYGLAPSGQPAFASWGQNPSTGGLKGTLDGATAGNNFTCALQQGSALCWGQNDQGQLGRGANGASDPNAAQVNGLSSVTEVRAGYDHACAFVGPYKMKCWGNNKNGELGNNSTTEGDAPVDVQSWP